MRAVIEEYIQANTTAMKSYLVRKVINHDVLRFYPEKGSANELTKYFCVVTCT